MLGQSTIINRKYHRNYSSRSKRQLSRQQFTINQQPAAAAAAAATPQISSSGEQTNSNGPN
jgi:hypothetical protein